MCPPKAHPPAIDADARLVLEEANPLPEGAVEIVYACA
jgi:hypothetical protein